MAETPTPTTSSNTRNGVIFGVAAYAIWALIAIYFKAVASVPPLEVIAHRIIGCVIVLSAILLWQRRGREVITAFTTWRHLRSLLLTTLLIGTNWFVFIWAVVNDRVLEASLGYFINPLVNVVLGVIFLGESLNRPTKIAVALAAFGVSAQLILVGSLPIVALVLAFSFGFYGLLRKTVHTGAVPGLLVETSLLAPAAVAYLIWLTRRGELVFGSGSLTIDILLLSAGIITAIPLLCFTTAARLLPLTTMGFLQYLAPSGQFLIAVLLFGEPLTPATGLTFACIWAALGIFTWDRVRRSRLSTVG